MEEIKKLNKSFQEFGFKFKDDLEKKMQQFEKEKGNLETSLKSKIENNLKNEFEKEKNNLEDTLKSKIEENLKNEFEKEKSKIEENLKNEFEKEKINLETSLKNQELKFNKEIRELKNEIEKKNKKIDLIDSGNLIIFEYNKSQNQKNKIIGLANEIIHEENIDVIKELAKNIIKEINK